MSDMLVGYGIGGSLIEVVGLIVPGILRFRRRISI